MAGRRGRAYYLAKRQENVGHSPETLRASACGSSAGDPLARISAIMGNVAISAETKLQEAMERLLSGKSLHTDGKLTKANLAREAHVSPATLYRTKSVIQAWDQRVTQTTPRNPEAERLRSELATKRSRIRELEADVSKLKDDLTAAVTVIAELSARLTSKEQATVTSLEHP